MSEQNLEAVRRAWQAFNRGDLDGFFADEFRNGLIVRVRAYLDRTAGRAAAGLAE